MTPEKLPSPEAERKSSHKTKKRKRADPEQRDSSKKRKQLEASLENAPDTPTQTPKPKTNPQPLNHASRSLPSYPLAPVTLPDSDHDTPITDAPLTTTVSTPPTSSPFHTTTLSLYLPLPAIALSPTTALPSLLTTHLAPLLLTYYPPLRGIILSLSNPILSSKKPRPDHPPPSPDPTDPDSHIVLAHCADADGLSYIWLTATFLLFKPQIRDELEGWVNVCSEGFVGLVCYNYFQVAVARSRIPGQWRWVPPGGEVKGKVRRGRKKKTGKRKNVDEEEEKGEEGATSQETLVNGDGGAGEDENKDEEERESGYFQREDGSRVKGSVRFRVVDCEIVPGHVRENWSLQIEGTLLSAAEEERVLVEERQKAQRRQDRAVMSGGLGSNGRNGSLSHSRRGTPS